MGALRAFVTTHLADGTRYQREVNGTQVSFAEGQSDKVGSQEACGEEPSHGKAVRGEQAGWFCRHREERPMSFSIVSFSLWLLGFFNDEVVLFDYLRSDCCMQK